MVEFACVIKGFLGIAYGIDHMPSFAKAHLEVVTEQVFVFDDENFHGCS